MQLSISQIAAYNSCPHRWHLRYQRNLTPLKPASYLELGKAVHAAVATGIRRQYNAALAETAALAQYNALTERGEDWEEQRALAADIARRTVEHLAELGFETVELGGKELIEVGMLNTIIAPPFTFLGIVDWVARDPDGLVWLIDFKVRQRMQEGLEFDTQMAVYQYLLAMAGVHTAGSLQFQIKAASPAVPSRNKDGSLSRAKIATTWEVYMRELRRLGLQISDYSEMPAKLAEIEWFRCTREYRSSDTLARVWQAAVLPLAAELQAPSTRRILSSYNCTTCGFAPICSAFLVDADTESVVQEGFALRTDGFEGPIFDLQAQAWMEGKQA